MVSNLPAPAPLAPVDLRPLTTTELIDRGFTLYRTHFTALLLLAVLSQSAPLLSQVFLTAMKLTPTFDEIYAHPELVYLHLPLPMLLTFGVQIFPFCFDIIITFYIADAYLGKAPSVRSSFRQFFKRTGVAIWTFLLVRLAIFVALLFPCVAILAVGIYVRCFPPSEYYQLFLIIGGGMLLLIASVVPVLAIFMRLMLTVPALALEDRSGWSSLRRSSQLVRYDPGLGILYWGEMRLSFLLLPLFVIEILILFLTSLPVSLHQMGEVMRNGSQVAAPPDATLIIAQILTFLAGAVIVPLYTIATTLFYYDVRVRREGFDLEFMTEQL